MIQVIRCHPELMAITKSRDTTNKGAATKDINSIKEVKDKQLQFKRVENEREVSLLTLPKRSSIKWKKRKDIISKIIDRLDYNNQIQSSYDLILLDRQQKYEHKDAA
tara:strand:- start:280 stop:600 length:321 start_codon:yes stop_codon:yes gene_type:complete